MGAAESFDLNRRSSERFDFSLPVRASVGERECVGASKNLSEGGACLDFHGPAPQVGASIKVAFDVPGHAESVEVEAEVRWAAKSSCGVMFRRGHQRLVALLVAGVLGGAANTASAAASTTVPTFDPNADVSLDASTGGGGERPDQQVVLEAFSRQYAAIDACVADTKGGRDKPLEGEAHVEVLLNPAGATPLGINTALPGKISKQRQLQECLRTAVATAEYPSYDGPPVVVEFSFELDPGFEEEPAE